MSKLLLVCGDQLFAKAHFRIAFPAETVDQVILVEDAALCRRRTLHQQKLTLVLAAMRHQAAELRNAGYHVHYVTLEQQQTVAAVLKAQQAATGADQLVGFEVHNQGQRRWIREAADAAGLAWTTTPSPMFLTDQSTFVAMTGAGSHKTLQMGRFYKAQRERLKVLIDRSGAPTGGRLSFDEDNRKRLPAQQTVPDMPQIAFDEVTQTVAELVRDRFPDNPGHAAELWLPTTRRGALAWLRSFIAERLHGFGTYEDAISTRSPTLFHSALAPLLNIGLLTPQEVLERVLEQAQEQQVPINDLEGFVRQLIGWREFIRGVYESDGAAMRTHNARNQQRQPGPAWYSGRLGIPPYDDAIATMHRYGWNHHIDRLMVIANLMNLAELEPTRVCDFFMDHYLDAYDWVMVPNVYGMGLNSDANTFATKPYICGSNYWLKMSDYRRGDWCDVVDGLYWRFVAEHRETLASNPRTAMMPRNLDRLKPARQSLIFSAAHAFLDRHTTEAA